MGELEVGEQVIANREHIGPQKTGDNIAAKRSAAYGFGSDKNWLRMPLPLIDLSFDYLDYTPATTTDTYKFYQGGSGGIVVRTIVITYTDSTKSVLSNVART